MVSSRPQLMKIIIKKIIVTHGHLTAETDSCAKVK